MRSDKVLYKHIPSFSLRHTGTIVQICTKLLTRHMHSRTRLHASHLVRKPHSDARDWTQFQTN